MSLTECPECGHGVSSAATVCPSCGYVFDDRAVAGRRGDVDGRRRRGPRIGTMLLGLIVLAFLALAAAWYFGIVRFV